MQWSAGTAHCGALRLTLLHSGTVLDLYVKIWYKKKKNSFEKKKTKPNRFIQSNIKTVK